MDNQDEKDIAEAQDVGLYYEKNKKEEEPKTQTLDQQLENLSLEQAFNILVNVTKKVDMKYDEHRVLAHSIKMVHMALNKSAK